ALALCRRTYFDVALLDYEMPLMSGSRLAQEIKFLVPDVPVVLISGRTTLPPAELAFVDAHFGFFFFNDAAPTEIYTLSLHDALPIWGRTASASSTGSTGSSTGCRARPA